MYNFTNSMRVKEYAIKLKILFLMFFTSKAKHYLANLILRKKFVKS